MHGFLKKYVFQICFWSGLILQLFHTHTYFTYQGSDRNLQILAGINLLEGNGYSVQEASVDDLSQTVFTPLKGWPPGYSMLIIPFYLLTKDIFLSAEIIAWLGILLCFSGGHFLLQLLKPYIHRWVYPVFFLFWGISFTPFHFTAAADEWALGCFLWGTFFWLKLWFQHDKKWLLNILMGTLFFWAAGLIRYAYYPFVLVPVGIGGLVYWMNRDRKHWVITSVFSIMAFISFWMISTPMVGTVDALSDVYGNQKIFWENLGLMDAFPVKSFFYLSVEGIANKVGGIAPFLSIVMKVSMLVLSLVLLSVLFSWKEKKKFPSTFNCHPEPSSVSEGSKHPKRSKGAYGVQQDVDCSLVALVMLRSFAGLRMTISPEKKAFYILRIFTLTILFITTLMLVFLSLKAPATIFGEFIWTYVRETRFYAPVLVLLQIFFLDSFFTNNLKGFRKWVLRGFVIVGIVYSCGHSFYRYAQRYIFGDFRETRYSLEDQYIKTLSEAIPHLAMENPLVWVHESGIYPEDEAAVVRWSGESSIPVELLLENEMYSEKPVDIVFKLEKETLDSLINKNPHINWNNMFPLIINPSDTLYRLNNHPNEK